MYLKSAGKKNKTLRLKTHFGKLVCYYLLLINTVAFKQFLLSIKYLIGIFRSILDLQFNIVKHLSLVLDQNQVQKKVM